jgi:hypothetical protein
MSRRRRKAGPCLMGNVARRRDGTTYAKFPRGCAGFRTTRRSGICASCWRKWGTK